MSVVKSQRTDKSDMCYLANEIEYKIIRMTMNEKYFPKRARFVISNRLVDLSMYDLFNKLFIEDWRLDYES